jgi:hypothetical protein
MPPTETIVDESKGPTNGDVDDMDAWVDGEDDDDEEDGDDNANTMVL